MRRRLRVRRWAAMGTACLALLGGAASAQQIQLRGRVMVAGSEEAQVDSAANFPSDRETLRRMNRAEDLLKESNWTDSVLLLGAILEASEDYFYPTPEDPNSYRSVKSRVMELVGGMPEEGRRRYELEYGFAARKLLDEAAREGGTSKLEEAARRFFHTTAGYEATYRLGLHHLDHGRPLAASLCLERLRKFPAGKQYEPVLSIQTAICLCHVGSADALHQAVQVLRSVRRDFAVSKLSVGGKELPLPEVDKIDRTWAAEVFGPAVRPLVPGQEEWVMHRGNPARNASSLGGAPLLNARWKVPVSNDQPRVDEIVQEVETGLLQRNEAIVPSLVPLAVQLNPREASRLQIGSIRSSKWASLLDRFKTEGLSATDGPGKRLWERLSAGLKEELVKREAGSTPDRTLRQRTIDELNALFDRRDLYEPAAWNGVDLRTEADQLLRIGVERLSADQVVRLNRVLFEAAYRQEVLRSFADVVLMRTYNNLIAVDFVTGKRVWQIPLAEETDLLGKLLRTDGGTLKTSGQVVGPVSDRLWHDAAFGTLASDGRLVFSVEDLPIRTVQQNGMAIINRNQPGGGRDFNRLAAHEIRTGKLVWEVGGAKGDSELKLSGQFFLGPPLPLGGSLYTLAESANEVRLVVLDGTSGETLWTQNLAEAQNSLAVDAGRRQAGVSPAYADGVLVCPTAAGAVVAVDLTGRSLLWGYRYEYQIQSDPNQAQMIFGGRQQTQAVSAERWVDSVPILTGGYVLLTPTESNELHCLRLTDGSVAWKKARGDGLYIGGVQEDIAIVVGTREIRGLRIGTGKEVWKTGYPDSAAVPSGRGFLSDNTFYLPLSTAEVVSIDIRNGRVVARAKSRQGTIPGNLICFRGTVVSQSARSLESFDELKGLETLVAGDLKRNPEDPTALSQRGEILLQSGQVALAVADFRKSLGLKFDERTLGLLVDSLLEGLRVDYVANRAQAPEVLELIGKLPEDQRRQAKTRYLRAVATGQQRQKEYLAAFRTFLTFTEGDTASPELERIEGVWSVRGDRWVQARLDELFGTLSAAERESVEKIVQAHLDAAVSESGTAGLERFVDFFGVHPAGRRARLLLADRRIAAGQWLKAELSLRAALVGAEGEEQREATVLLGDLYRQANRPRDAARLWKPLAGDWAELPCGKGLTGKQWLDKLGPSDPIRELVFGNGEFPTGLVKAERTKGNSYPSWRYLPIEMKGTQEAAFGHGSILLDQQQRRFIGRDRYGKQTWEANPVDERDRFQNFGMNAFAISAHTYGHAALICTGQHVLAVDTLTPDSANRVLWKEPLVQTVPGNAVPQGIRFNFVARGRKQRLVAQTVDGQPIGPTGPLTGTYAAFIRRKELTVVDPTTGKPLWVRHDCTPGSDLFGDDEFLICIPPDSGKATVYRALDGRQVRTVEVGGEDQRLETVGRHIVRRRTGGNNQEIVEILDVAKDEVVWTEKYVSGSKVCMTTAGNELAVVQPDGKFEIRAVPSGKQLAADKFEPQKGLTDLYVLASEERWLVLPTRPNQAQANNQLIVNGINGNIDSPVVNGVLHGVERSTGKRAWSRPIENQALHLRQLPEMPALVLAVRTQRRQGNSYLNESELQCIDKRTGRVVFKESLKNEPINGMDIEANPERKTMEVKLTQSTVKLTFTGDPLPPETPEKPKEEKDTEDD